MRVLFVGGWGHHYLRELMGPGALVAGVCGDGLDDMARLVADSLPDSEWLDDPETAIAAFGPDVVSVGAVYGDNGRWVLTALGAGLPVVSDKPVVATLEQYEKLVEVPADLPVLTELPGRCDAATRTAREAVAAGRIGAPILVTAQKSYKWGFRPDWYADRERYVGTVAWVASHGLDSAEFVSGESIVRVAGRGTNVARPEMAPMPDHVVVTGELSGGGTVVVHADYARPEPVSTHGDDRLRVAGSEGVLEVIDGRCWLLGDRPEPEDITADGLARGVGRELAAALDGTSATFSTTHTHRLARLILSAEASMLDWEQSSRPRT